MALIAVGLCAVTGLALAAAITIRNPMAFPQRKLRPGMLAAGTLVLPDASTVDLDAGTFPEDASSDVKVEVTRLERSLSALNGATMGAVSRERLTPLECRAGPRDPVRRLLVKPGAPGGYFCVFTNGGNIAILQARWINVLFRRLIILEFATFESS